jgi:hypothetical protein
MAQIDAPRLKNSETLENKWLSGPHARVSGRESNPFRESGNSSPATVSITVEIATFINTGSIRGRGKAATQPAPLKQ